MIYSSKGFSFAGYNSGSFISSNNSPIEIYNVVLENDMYTQPIIGNRNIQEVKIPGRDKPYLYEIDEEPMEFDLQIAFVNPVKTIDARKIARWLLTPKTYQPLSFENDENKVFYAIFTGEAQFSYVSNSTGASFNKNISINHTNGITSTVLLHEALSITTQAGVTFNSNNGLLTVADTVATGVITVEYQVYESQLVGYISLHARCNAPTAFSLLTTTQLLNVSTNLTYMLAVDGDYYTEPDLEIVIPEILPDYAAVTVNGIIIRNNTNSSFIGFTNLEAGEIINISSMLKTISSTEQSVAPIYPRWSRTDFILEIDANNIVIELYNDLAFDSYGNITAGTLLTGTYNGSEIQYKIDYQAPKFI